MRARARSAYVLTGVVLTFAVLLFELWFFSRPAAVNRKQATSNLVTFAVQTLTLSAVTGFAAMATLEMMKRLLHLRGWFFFLRVPGPEFLRSTQREKSEESKKLEQSEESEESEESEGAPAVSSREGIRRCDLPLEQLMAQLGYATDQALNHLFPTRVEPDRSSAAGARRAALGESLDADDANVALLARLVGEAYIQRAIAQNDPTSLRLKAQTALDDLQVNVGNAWRWWLRLISSLLATLFALFALLYILVPPGIKIAALVGSFLLGGFFAGFFRDLTAIAERLRSLCTGILFSVSRCEVKVLVAILFP